MRITIGIKIFGIFVSQKVWMIVRRISLHTSCAGFSMDFIHSCIGNAMILSGFFEQHHEVIITWSALAGVIIVYIDGFFERTKEEHKQDEDGNWQPIWSDPVA